MSTTIEAIIEDALGDAVERTIIDSYLEDYKTFKQAFAKLKPTKQIYEELKKDDNWASYDYIGEWNKYYPNWKKVLKEEYKKALAEENFDPTEAQLNFLESDELSDASANIAAGILETAIKDIKMKNKKLVKV